jgi:hypothetical protein
MGVFSGYDLYSLMDSRELNDVAVIEVAMKLSALLAWTSRRLTRLTFVALRSPFGRTKLSQRMHAVCVRFITNTAYRGAHPLSGNAMPLCWLCCACCANLLAQWSMACTGPASLLVPLLCSTHSRCTAPVIIARSFLPDHSVHLQLQVAAQGGVCCTSRILLVMVSGERFHREVEFCSVAWGGKPAVSNYKYAV